MLAWCGTVDGQPYFAWLLLVRPGNNFIVPGLDCPLRAAAHRGSHCENKLTPRLGLSRINPDTTGFARVNVSGDNSAGLADLSTVIHQVST